MKKTTIGSLIEELKALRINRDRADARLLLRLAEVRRDHLQLLLDDGYESFAKFCHQFVSPERQEAFERGLEKIGAKKALEIGSEATIIAAKLTGNGNHERYTAAVRDWSSSNNGLLPSRQASERLLYKIDPRAEEPRVSREQREVTKLRLENDKLRAEVRLLRGRIKVLETRLKERATA